ncbi:glucosamine inositolphosphorylceramide transferase family protein [Bacteroides pyogenes]|uniref:glucosamine inositolphosphorylceramide transferase family protein n=1 Tax=Bacteroides pyogenes TaxID=310300 RepID=UPI0020119806|nr:hypothetical protein [Bacteroides pyogenes]MBR8704737.1 hypothetical protein [Bacteroides pyogenes]
MNLYYSRICRKLGLAKTTEWGIAIRKASDYEGILSDRKNHVPFEIIPNTNEFWFADPLLFEDNGKTWLFVEAFNYSTHKGELGVFDVIDGKPQNFRVIITTPTHMSYPCVFKHNGEYYMIPETGAAKEIVLYKATSFPDGWKREKVLLTGEVFRDTTAILESNGSYTLLAYKQIGTNGFNMKYFVTKFVLDMNNLFLTFVDEYYDKKKCNRPAGLLFSTNGEIYRVAQKCDKAYGEAIYVYKTDNDLNFQQDKKVAELRGQNIVLNDGRKPILLHTYSQAGGVEVIDFRCLL